MKRLYGLSFSDSPAADKIRRIRMRIDAALRSGEIKNCDCGPLQIDLKRRNQGLYTAFINCYCGKQRGKTVDISLR